MQDVFFYEAFEEEAEAIRLHLKPGMRAGFTPKTIQEYGAHPVPARVVSVRTQSLFPADWKPGSFAILTRSTGYDHVAAYRRRTGAAVESGYLPLYCNRAVAEQAMLLWMALLRRMPVQLKNFQTFQRDGLTGRECAGKTLGVFGVGHIGSEIVRIGHGLGMRVLPVDIVQQNPDLAYVYQAQALAESDIIVCAMNLTEENCGYFRYQTLREARRGLLFVNVARGEFAPAADLLHLLEENYLGGVALDVYNHESELAVSLRTGRVSGDPEVQSLLKLARDPRVICTPHNAFNTAESVERKAEHSVRQLEAYLATGRFLWPVP